MRQLRARTWCPWLLAALAAAGSETARAGDWTAPVEVLHEQQRCISYRARLSGEFVEVQATIEPGWHTFAMDNKQRAAEKLAGKRSLGIDAPTQILLSDGLEVAGPWYQPEPKDFSKPELRWYSWGYEQQARFAAKMRRTGAGPARMAIRGQACTESICKNIDVELSLPVDSASAAGPAVDLKNLVEVRAAQAQ
jgi:DsbC/DsbD-like thiol-disulfide interchange protein